MVKADNENERIFLQFFETLGSGDLAKIREQFHEQAIWQVQVKGIAGAGEHKGRKGIVDDFLAPVRGMFKPGDPKVIMTSIASKGALVIGESIGRGTFMDGRPYENLYAWAVEIKDGKVWRLREYMDSFYVSKLQEATK
ncbi:MAG TPA: nuclear transport factor 2 family protein [Steroidobacteraceae bacterium]|nr:nuclear transport factor 2 family protein [Steroidobacteraceae bacterium]